MVEDEFKALRGAAQVEYAGPYTVGAAKSGPGEVPATVDPAFAPVTGGAR